MILNLNGAPTTPLERLMWLSGVREQTLLELELEFRRIYFQLRLEGRLDAAEALSLHSHKRIMAFTRAENNARGRSVRWGDKKG